ncbi:hypothetical protein B296_00018558 [Ensete ventricosum]|uniref:DUF3456 domain-containing protein n=1 Tax=Ensete ventricosum TaxID=4639 RepID=A0A427AUE4_ENSVE|nr:hypothetical protein B296_00018558 [Ensete ventricosum]
MEAKRRSGAAILGSAIRLAAILTVLAPVASIDDRCAACNAVAVLVSRSFPFRLTSPRALEAEIEIGLSNLDSGEHAWIKVRDWNSIEGDKQEARAYSKGLSSFCGR